MNFLQFFKRYFATNQISLSILCLSTVLFYPAFKLAVLIHSDSLLTTAAILSWIIIGVFLYHLFKYIDTFILYYDLSKLKTTIIWLLITVAIILVFMFYIEHFFYLEQFNLLHIVTELGTKYIITPIEFVLSLLFKTLLVLGVIWLAWKILRIFF